MSKLLATGVVGLVCLLAAVAHSQSLAAPEADDSVCATWTVGVSLPHTRVVLSSKLDENITAINVEEGQNVRKGQPLLEFDSRVIKAQIVAAEVGADFDARIASADARHEYLRNELKRLQDTGEEWVRGVDADKAQFEVKMAQLDGQELRRSKKLAEAQLALYQARAHDYTILSPIDGVVSHVWYDPGEMAQRGEPLIEVIDPDVIEVRVQVCEKYAADLAPGRRASVRFQAVEDREFEGRVWVVAPEVDSSLRKFAVKVLVEPNSELVKPGMSCEVKFLEED